MLREIFRERQHIANIAGGYLPSPTLLRNTTTTTTTTTNDHIITKQQIRRLQKLAERIPVKRQRPVGLRGRMAGGDDMFLDFDIDEKDVSPQPPPAAAAGSDVHLPNERRPCSSSSFPVSIWLCRFVLLVPCTAPAWRFWHICTAWKEGTSTKNSCAARAKGEGCLRGCPFKIGAVFPFRGGGARFAVTTDSASLLVLLCVRHRAG